jgi:hypothetical protein
MADRKAVYVTTEGKDGKNYWTRIGVAFVNRDGSLNVKLEAFPVNAQFHIRDFNPRDDERDNRRDEPRRDDRRDNGG